MTRTLDVVSDLSTSRITITPRRSSWGYEAITAEHRFQSSRGGYGIEGFARISFKFTLQITIPSLLHTSLSLYDKEQAARDQFFCLWDGVSFLPGPELGWSGSRAVFGACKNYTDCSITSAQPLFFLYACGFETRYFTLRRGKTEGVCEQGDEGNLWTLEGGSQKRMGENCIKMDLVICRPTLRIYY